MTGDVPEALRHVNPRPWLDALTDGRLVCADVGKAGVLGSLSVPPSWVTASPQTEPFPDSRPPDSLDARGVRRGRTFQHGLMATINQCGATTYDDERDESGNDETQVEEH
ncbi:MULTISPECIES: PE/PPE C-terminal domain-containing protein [unclassified Mycobacterium]|uniref:PE/PPE C-terminal domain-containing protein n=1 Tax=Mycobacterium sp. 4858 TaxID=2057185 RepID=UPI0009EEE69D